MVAWWVSDAPPQSQPSLWPAALIVLGLAMIFVPLLHGIAAFSESTPGSLLIYGLLHTLFAVLFALAGVVPMARSAYAHLAAWFWWAIAANAALWCLLALAAALRRPRV